jgi:anti-anti-sigma factor
MSPDFHDLRVERPEAGKAVVLLEGEHDLATVPELRDLLDDLASENRLLVVDLSETSFADSITLNALVNAKQLAEAHDCRFRIQMGPTALLYRVFEVAGLLATMDVVPTREEALET